VAVVAPEGDEAVGAETEEVVVSAAGSAEIVVDSETEVRDN